jgi:hypothetical protein
MAFIEKIIIFCQLEYFNIKNLWCQHFLPEAQATPESLNK